MKKKELYIFSSDLVDGSIETKQTMQTFHL